MKKAFFRLMLTLLGLNLFTACYGPAPGVYREMDETIEAESGDGAEACTAEAEDASGQGAQEGSESSDDAEETDGNAPADGQ